MTLTPRGSSSKRPTMTSRTADDVHRHQQSHWQPATPLPPLSTPIYLCLKYSKLRTRRFRSGRVLPSSASSKRGAFLCMTRLACGSSWKLSCSSASRALRCLRRRAASSSITWDAARAREVIPQKRQCSRRYAETVTLYNTDGVQLTSPPEGS